MGGASGAGAGAAGEVLSGGVGGAELCDGSDGGLEAGLFGSILGSYWLNLNFNRVGFLCRERAIFYNADLKQIWSFRRKISVREFEALVYGGVDATDAGGSGLFFFDLETLELPC